MTRMDRSGGRGHRTKPRGGGDGRSPGRRTPPPPGTGLEARYLSERMNAGDTLELSMIDGRTLCGPVEAFDQDVITIRPDAGPVVVRKADIRYLREID